MEKHNSEGYCVIYLCSRALCIEATSHVIWHRNLLAGIGFNQCAATTVFEDNQAAIAVCENDVVTRRIKCVGVRLSFLRDQVNDDVVDLVYVASEENTADIFTKALTVVPFEFMLKDLDYRIELLCIAAQQQRGGVLKFVCYSLQLYVMYLLSKFHVIFSCID